MSTQPALNYLQHVNSIPDLRSEAIVKREICLDALRAAQWVVCLEELLASATPCDAVRQFYDDLSDACWLARWKRENVVVDIEVCATPQLISQLMQAESHAGTASPLLDILETLARNR
jgi:hypothetical protein